MFKQTLGKENQNSKNLQPPVAIKDAVCLHILDTLMLTAFIFLIFFPARSAQ